MTETIDTQTYSETYATILALGEDYINRVPQDIFEFIKNQSDTDYLPQIDQNKALNEQGLSDNTLAMIATLHYNYWCNSEEEKAILWAVFEANQKKLDEKLNSTTDLGCNLKLVPINEELKRYFSLHPEKLYNITPRKFEELVADILKDFGFDVELTSATRDGGFDIYAYMKTQIGTFLTFVECKRWTPPNNVGIEVVQRLQGVQHINNAHKSMIVTTSYFTQPAILASRARENLMTLVDYNDLKKWLENYHKIE